MKTQRTIKQETIAIFVYWSNCRIISKNTLTYLKELQKIASTVLFVSNSKVNETEIENVYTEEILFLQRKNEGFDFWGWKEGIFFLENKIKNASNLILCNSSCFLAFNRLDIFFQRMDEGSDVWGITSFEEKNIPFHLQSYFLVFKNTILNDWCSFCEFWACLPPMKSWQDAVKLGEQRLTNFYQHKGFKCRAVFESSEFPTKDLNPSFFYPVEVLKKGSPFLKKKIYLEEYKHTLIHSYGDSASSAMMFVRENGGRYEEILQELIRSTTPSNLIQVLDLNYLVNYRVPPNNKVSSNRIAVVCFVYYEEMTHYMETILKRFEKLADIYIISSKEQLLEHYKMQFAKRGVEIECRIQENRGRNEAAYFITCKDIWSRYEYVCALHDKKTSHAKPALLGVDFMRHCEQNLCPTPNSVLEVVHFFDSNPLLGLLVPPVPLFGNFISSLLNPLGRNLESIKKLNEHLSLGLTFSKSKDIDVLSAPFGGMFWARTKALIPIAQASLRLEHVPKEPLMTSDGTILHAMERSYPLVVKNSGFYTARVINLAHIPHMYDNLLYYSFRLSFRERVTFLLTGFFKKYLSTYPSLYQFAASFYRKFLS